MNKVLTIALTLLLVIACKTPEARKPISSKSGSFINESVARNRELNKKEQAAFENIMQQHDNNYIASENGFWYYYNNQITTDTLQTPQFGDIVNYNYNVKALNGNLIYSKADIKTQNYAMDQEELFTGLRQGLKLMKTGETVTFLFPSQQAFGYYGDSNRIGTNVPLICEVTINSISKKQNN